MGRELSLRDRPHLLNHRAEEGRPLRLSHPSPSPPPPLPLPLPPLPLPLPPPPLLLLHRPHRLLALVSGSRSSSDSSCTTFVRFLKTTITSRSLRFELGGEVGELGGGGGDSEGDLGWEEVVRPGCSGVVFSSFTFPSRRIGFIRAVTCSFSFSSLKFEFPRLFSFL